jgi:phosphinothricin acetyltransferase
MVLIRKATVADVPAITEIYNEAVLTTNATFDSEPKTVAQQQDWFRGHDGKHPILVAETDAGVVAWASLSEWSTRCAYSATAEISIYVRGSSRGHGIGKKLMAEIIPAGEACGLHTVLSRITEGNGASVHLHELQGFETVGIMREVGNKFDRLLDVRMMQKIYEKKPASAKTRTRKRTR